jgi:hypothetical protein
LVNVLIVHPSVFSWRDDSWGRLITVPSIVSLILLLRWRNFLSVNLRLELLLLLLGRHFIICKRFQQIACKISIIFLLLIVIFVGKDGGEVSEFKVKSNLIDLIGKIVGRGKRDRHSWGVGDGVGWRWWETGNSIVAPSALIDHLGFLVNRLIEGFNGGHGIFRIEVIYRRGLKDERRHKNSEFLTFSLNI